MCAWNIGAWPRFKSNSDETVSSSEQKYLHMEVFIDTIKANGIV